MAEHGRAGVEPGLGRRTTRSHRGDRGPYGASQAALIAAHTEELAAQPRPGIRVNAVAPAVVTDPLRRGAVRRGARRRSDAAYPMRPARADRRNVAALVGFLGLGRGRFGSPGETVPVERAGSWATERAGRTELTPPVRATAPPASVQSRPVGPEAAGEHVQQSTQAWPSRERGQRKSNHGPTPGQPVHLGRAVCARVLHAGQLDQVVQRAAAGGRSGSPSHRPALDQRGQHRGLPALGASEVGTLQHEPGGART
jgi:hypothetical protein